jgi:hypothetical protein
MSLHDGVCAFTITPSESNPISPGLLKFQKEYEWMGVLHPKCYAYVPFKIRFRSLSLKSEEEKVRFEKVLALKIQMIWNAVIKGILETKTVEDNSVESWMEVIKGMTLIDYNLHIFVKGVYGDVFGSVLQVLIPELVSGIVGLEDKFDYMMTLDRFDEDAMLIGTLHREDRKERFVQRLHDQDIQVSAYKWDLGVNIRGRYLWKKPWVSFLEHLI